VRIWGEPQGSGDAGDLFGPQGGDRAGSVPRGAELVLGPTVPVGPGRERVVDHEVDPRVSGAQCLHEGVNAHAGRV